MRRIAFVRPALCSVLILAVGVAPWNAAMAAPAAGSKPAAPTTTTPSTTTTTPSTTTTTPSTTTTTPPTDTTTTPPTDTTTPPTDTTTPPGETPPGETPPGETPPGETGETPPEDAAETPPEPVEPPPPVPVTPPPDPMADRPPEPQVGGKPRKGVNLMIAGGTVLGVGLATTITFGMITQHCKYSGPLQCKYREQDQFLIPMGAAVTLLGAMLLGVGVGYHLGYKKWERWTPEVAAAEKAKADKRNRRGRGKKQTAFAPAMLRGGAAMVLGGRF